MAADAPPEDSVINILVASDLHLGYNEKDPIRGEDSFVTFNEVFQIANERKVDMVLLAGDLFHDNKPSRKALQRCMETLRDHCLGDREVKLEVVSDQSTNFHGKYREVNYENPNYNIQLPVFSIHGNHDDPAGDGGLAALDLLSTANLVNYFGRASNVEKIALAPILIKKGSTKLALYGLGHVRDERLARSFDRKEVTVARPAAAERDSWFNLMAIHQNRLPRGAGVTMKGYIKEALLPNCMDLVVWGHEHECTIEGGMYAVPESAENQFTVIQPGSTVATSLVEGEAKPKHVALLSIKDDNWKMESIPLTTVRPFLLREVVLADHADDYELHDERTLMDMLGKQVDEMLAEVKEKTATPITQAAENRAKFPLLRLKVDYTGFTTCNPQRFGQRFVDKVANPSELLLFQRKAKKEDKADKKKEGTQNADPERDQDKDPAVQIQDLVGSFLRGGKEQLRLLPQADLDTAVFDGYVSKGTKTAIQDQVEKSLKQMQGLLNSEHRDHINQSTDRKAKESEIEKFVRERAAASGTAAGADEEDEDGPSVQQGANPASSDDDGMGSDGEGAAPVSKAKAPAKRAPASKAAKADAPARGRGRGRGAAAGRGRGRGAAAKGGSAGSSGGVPINLSDDDDDDGFGAGADTEQAPARSKRASTTARAAATKRSRRENSDDDPSDEDDAGYVQPPSPAASSKAKSFASKRRMR